MFNGESKKRPTVSLRGKSKEEDRTEFIRRARVRGISTWVDRLQLSDAKYDESPQRDACSTRIRVAE